MKLYSAALLFLAGCASGQVIGVDLGSEFIKIAGVKPGSNIDVVLNEQSKRKSNNYIGYRGDDRFLGEDAHNLAPRFPNQMYTFVNRLAGKSWADDSFKSDFVDGWNLFYDLIENENRSTISISHSDPKQDFTSEELLAQILAYVKGQADKHLEIPVLGAVVTIPHFFTLKQRTAIVQAGNLTGLPILGLMSSTQAAALHYGVQRRGFGNKTANVIIYDMGSSQTEVGAFRYHPADESPKKGSELGKLETLAIVNDETLGGRAMDAKIANHFAEVFKEQTGIDVFASKEKANLKAITVLMKAANKAKEMLSANKAAPVAIEELIDGKRFDYNMKREKLDEVCGDLFAKATPLLQSVMQKANLTVEDLTAVEIIGGGIRIPRLQNEMSESLNGRQLDKTLNGDECMALGATFRAASLSGTFRTKGFAITDAVPYNVTFKLSQLPGSEKAPKMRPLFMNSPSNVKKSITVSRTADFEIELYASAGEQEELYRTYNIEEIATTLDGMNFNKEDKNESSTHSVQVFVRLGSDGLVNVEGTTVKYDEHTLVDKKVKIKEPKVNVTEATAEGEKKEGEEEPKEGEEPKTEGEEEKKEEEPKEDEKKEEKPAEGEEEKKTEDEKPKEGEEATEEKKEAEEEKKPQYKIVQKLNIKKHRKPVSYKITETKPLPMNDEDNQQSKDLLARLQEIEDRKREVSAIKNELEAYIYSLKFETLLDNEDMQEFISDEDREKITAVLEEVSEWIEYGEGSDDSTKKEAFLEKREALEAAVSVVTDKKKAKEDAEKQKEIDEKKAAEEEAKKPEDEEKAEEATEESSDKTEEEAKSEEEPKSEEGKEL
eukprot:TRINITY_DN2271_c0_g3_i5.p1 TRINITY_DN2271_c0_g3~~TRINITY_DN2271_c0_g3_i5.p1  ORF type:complete len:832 (+),score=290.47 TRINITY_DN2271_c0_g3_i5:152-2647(+)